jgi:hypothetical protein
MFCWNNIVLKWRLAASKKWLQPNQFKWPIIFWCVLFQQDLNRLQGWCRENKYDLNAAKCKSILFSCGSKPVVFQYGIGDSDLERVDVNMISVCLSTAEWLLLILSSRLCRNQLECWDLLSEFQWSYTNNTLYVAFVWPGLEYASCLIKKFIRRGLNGSNKFF